MRLIIVFISLFACANSMAQSLEETYQLAKTAHKAGNYSGAISLYSRVSFFDSSSSLGYKCNIAIADCYLKSNKTGQALKYFDRAINGTTSNYTQDSLLLEKARIQIKKQQFNYALQDLFTISGKDKEQKKTTIFYTSICYFGLDDYSSFNEYFQSLELEKNDSISIHEISEVLSKKMSPKRVNRIKVLSYILPGTGQVATGAYRDGLNSFVLVSGLLTLYYITVKEYGIVNGLIAVSPWFTRYYGGGVENAIEAALNQQARIKDRYFSQVLKIAAKYIN